SSRNERFPFLKQQIISRSCRNQRGLFFLLNLLLHDLACEHRTTDPREVHSKKLLLSRSHDPQPDKMLTLRFRLEHYRTKPESPGRILQPCFKSTDEFLGRGQPIHAG